MEDRLQVAIYVFAPTALPHPGSPRGWVTPCLSAEVRLKHFSRNCRTVVALSALGIISDEF
jgi:hypothetical protein